MSINKKNMFNYLFKNNSNVRTRVWYNKDKINLQNESGFNVNMKKNKNSITFPDNKSKKFTIKFIEREKKYPLNTTTIKEGIGINYMKIIISENRKKDNTINHEYIIVNSNPSLSQKSNLFQNNISLQKITSNIKKSINSRNSLGIHNPYLLQKIIPNNKNSSDIHNTILDKINLIYISTEGIEYKELFPTIVGDSTNYSNNNIDYFNLNIIIPVEHDKDKIFILTKINEKINHLIQQEFTNQNINDLKTLFFNCSILINHYGYLINEENLRNEVEVINENTKKIIKIKVKPLTQKNINDFNQKYKSFKKFIETQKPTTIQNSFRE
jgi:hypothetical protein